MFRSNGSDKMSDRAQRVLVALIECDKKFGSKSPIFSISYFFDSENVGLTCGKVSEDYEALTIDEEKQVIQAFLESSY